MTVPDGGAEVAELVAIRDGAEVGDDVDRTKRYIEMKRQGHRGKVGKNSLGKLCATILMFALNAVLCSSFARVIILKGFDEQCGV